VNNFSYPCSFNVFKFRVLDLVVKRQEIIKIITYFV
jgi:hypothetical protein